MLYLWLLQLWLQLQLPQLPCKSCPSLPLLAPSFNTLILGLLLSSTLKSKHALARASWRRETSDTLEVRSQAVPIMVCVYTD